MRTRRGRTAASRSCTTGVTYDTLGRPAKITDNVPSTRTFTYDHTAEPRGLATKVVDSVAGAFTATYSADGSVDTEELPGGYTLRTVEDPSGSQTQRMYTRDSDGVLVHSDTVTKPVHSQATTRTGWSDQTFRYDAVGRLSSVEDTSETVCTWRSYGFDGRTNRTSLTTASSVPGTDCPTSGGTTRTSTYDTADRLVDSGYVYDGLGRNTARPDGTGIEYYANDLVYRETAKGQRQAWRLDAAQRFRSWTVETGSGSTWTQSASRINHYDGDSDSPRWIVEDPDTGALTRNVDSLGGGLAAITSKTGDVVLQLTSVHGDVVLQLPLDASKADYCSGDPVGCKDLSGNFSINDIWHEGKACAKYWWACWGVADDSYWAQREAKKAYKSSNKQNAYRHCIWQAMLVWDFGWTIAKAFGNAHEAKHKNTKDKAKRRDSQVDYYNNKVGRSIGSQITAWTRGRSAHGCLQALQEGTEERKTGHALTAWAFHRRRVRKRSPGRPRPPAPSMYGVTAVRNQASSPAGRRMPVTWTVALSLDFVLTCVSAMVLAGIGLLMPAFTEDYDGATAPWTAGFLTGAVILLGSLALSFVVLRSDKDGTRRIGLLLSLLRLGLIVFAAVGYVMYGVVVVESS